MSTIITAFFTSGSGNAAGGLSPLIRIRDVQTTTLVVTGTMTEVGDGWYKYSFIEYTGSNDYAITIDGNTSSLDNRFAYAGNESFVDDIWDAQISDHTVTGSMASALGHASSSATFTKEIENGTWKIVGSQMIFYASGANNELARFDLQDVNGIAIDPTTDNPFRRVRV